MISELLDSMIPELTSRLPEYEMLMEISEAAQKYHSKKE